MHRKGQPLIVYVHPREIDPNHPRLPLGPRRRFKCYVNLRSTMPKLKWLCEHYTFTTMATVAAQVAHAAGLVDVRDPVRCKRDRPGILVPDTALTPRPVLEQMSSP